MSGLIQNDLQPVESNFGEPTTRTYGMSDSGTGLVYGRPFEGLPPPQYSEKEKDLKRQIAELEKKLEEAAKEGLSEDDQKKLEDFNELVENKEMTTDEGATFILVDKSVHENLETQKSQLEEDLKNAEEQIGKLKSEASNAIEENARLTEELEKTKDLVSQIEVRNENVVNETQQILGRNVNDINVKIKALEDNIKSCTDEKKKQLSEQIKELEKLREQLGSSVVAGEGGESGNVDTARSSVAESEQSDDQSGARVDQELSKVSTLVSELNKLKLRSNVPDTALTFSGDDKAMKILDKTLLNSNAPLPEELNKLIDYPVRNVTNINLDSFKKSLELFYLLDNGPKNGIIEQSDIEGYYKSMGIGQGAGSTLYNTLAKTKTGTTKGSISIVEWIKKEPHNNKDFPVPKHWNKKVVEKESASGNAMFVNWL